MNEEYLLSLYNYIVESDPSYREDVSFEEFKSGMADQQYAASMYGFIGDLDPSFKDDVSVIDFIKDINTEPKPEEVKKN